MLEIYLAGAVLLVSILILSIRAPFALLSPVYALIATYLVAFCLGGLLYDPHYGGGGGRYLLSAADSYSLTLDVLWLLVAFTVGALASNVFAGGKRTVPGVDSSWGRLAFSPLQCQGALTFGLAAIALEVAGNGFSNIILRSEYLTDANHFSKVFGNALLPAAVIGLGAASTSRVNRYRWLSYGLASVALVLTLCINTRLFALVPALLFAGMLITNAAGRFAKYGLALALLAAPFLMILPLTGRQMRQQGLSTLPDLITEVSQLHLDKTVHELANNVFVSAPITVQSSRVNVGDRMNYFLLEVNPLPSFLAGWDYTLQFMLNPVTPLNAVGDLRRVGPLVSACYFFLIGLYFGHIDRKMRHAKRPDIGTLLLMAVSYLFIIISLQYPLRHASRLVYYMLGIEVLFSIARWMINNKKSEFPSRKPSRIAATPSRRSAR